MATKSLPLSKTVIADLDIQVADLHVRQRHLRAAVACRVPPTSNFTSSDATVAQETPLVIPNVTTVIVVYSLSNFRVRLGADANAPAMVCTGMFVFYGAAGAVTLMSVDATPVRLTYLWS